MPPSQKLSSGLGALFERYAGKKFAGLMIGLGSIMILVTVYLDLVGDQYEPESIAQVVIGAMFATSICVLGSAIGQGIADGGRSKNGT